MSAVNMQLEIFVLIAVGYILTKKGMISDRTQRQLTDLVINLILPCTIIKSLNMEITKELLLDTGIVLLISLCIQLFYSIMNKFLYNRMEQSEKVCCQYSTLVSNAGFIGMPVAEAMFGDTGLLYSSFFLIPMRIAMWSSGLALFSSGEDRKTVLKKVLTHPCLIAVYIGFGLMLLRSFGIAMPVFLENTVKALASCNTAMSMIVIGAILAGADVSQLMNKNVLVFSLYRLLVFPAVVYLILHLIGTDPVVTGVCVVLTGMPAGSTTAMLAKKYDGNSVFASALVFDSTVLSLVTLPILALLLGM